MILSMQKVIPDGGEDPANLGYPTVGFVMKSGGCACLANVYVDDKPWFALVL
jgi:hypothetical protein